MTDAKPVQYVTIWGPDARYIYDERIAIMREGNRIPDESPTPPDIKAVAVKAAWDAHNSLVNQ